MQKLPREMPKHKVLNCSNFKSKMQDAGNLRYDARIADKGRSDRRAAGQEDDFHAEAVGEGGQKGDFQDAPCTALQSCSFLWGLAMVSNCISIGTSRVLVLVLVSAHARRKQGRFER